MIHIRYNMFETNSSSTMTFAVDICQVEGLDIPPVVHIESNGHVGDNDINGVYSWAEYNDQTKQFFGLLKYSGVKEIYVDGKLVDADPEDRHVKILRPEVILSQCFGDHKSYSEWQGHGGEWDSSQYLNTNQVRDVVNALKDPRYLVICIDEDGNEIPWESTHYSKWDLDERDRVFGDKKSKKKTKKEPYINEMTKKLQEAGFKTPTQTKNN